MEIDGWDLSLRLDWDRARSEAEQLMAKYSEARLTKTHWGGIRGRESGVAAEMAFSALFRLPRRGLITTRTRGDGRADFTLSSGATVDIKCTAGRREAWPVVPPYENQHPADYYVFCRREKNELKICGYIDYATVQRQPKEVWNNPRAVWVIEPAVLLPIETLRAEHLLTFARRPAVRIRSKLWENRYFSVRTTPENGGWTHVEDEKTGLVLILSKSHIDLIGKIGIPARVAVLDDFFFTTKGGGSATGE